ncbi:hypothetical protein FJT64_010358 [Amphibalanus amphitrite]|uniref:Uncharacterized protein n=1 Tax=Amphibalanus amphitrite TaxID=1232801 RepID=A0A6A4VAF8_AMPAM|nr:hypothetical protein FJT64_010358 [Amphibalanus amphitrite]
MFLFADQLEYDEPMQEKVQRMAQFLLLFYVVAWLRAPVAEDAPANDLNLYRSLEGVLRSKASLRGLYDIRHRHPDVQFLMTSHLSQGCPENLLVLTACC